MHAEFGLGVAGAGTEFHGSAPVFEIAMPVSQCCVAVTLVVVTKGKSRVVWQGTMVRKGAAATDVAANRGIQAAVAGDEVP